MPKPDISALAQQMIEATRGAIARSEAALGARLALIEQQLRDTPLGQPGAKGEPGKDADPDVIAELISIEVAAQVGKLPKAKDGEPGKDSDQEQVKLLVAAAVSELPKPKDGAPGERGPAGESIRGEKGEPGAAVHHDTIALMVREAAEKIAAALPKPKDGADGFSLDDFDVSLAEDGRTLTLKFQRGELKRERTIKLETLIYREVWREGEYERGDVCTWGGSAWHCQQKTTDKPGTSASWKMMVKEGRPGKDGAAPVPASHKIVRTA